MYKITSQTSNKGFTMPCNTLFDKVKFRIKTTQFETLSNSCPRGDLMGGNGPEVFVQGRVIQGYLSRGESLGAISLKWPIFRGVVLLEGIVRR